MFKIDKEEKEHKENRKPKEETPYLFDQKLLLQRKLRALYSKSPCSSFLIDHTAEELKQRLFMIKNSFQHGIALFSYTNHTAKILRESKKVKNIYRIETHKAFLGKDTGFVSDPEIMPALPKTTDLIVSLLALHHTNNFLGLLKHICKSLCHKGLFLAAIPGNGTLRELRESLLSAETEMWQTVTPRVLPFISAGQASTLLQQAGFELPVTDVETITIRYDNLFSLMKDLRAMGETNILTFRKRTPSSQILFKRAAEIYAEQFSDSDGRIKVTFSIIWLSGWA